MHKRKIAVIGNFASQYFLLRPFLIAKPNRSSEKERNGSSIIFCKSNDRNTNHSLSRTGVQ